MRTPSLRVLLVEDNPVDAEYAVRSLSKLTRARFAVSYAGDLSEANRCLDTEHFDAVLLDLGLPECSGLEALEELHNKHPETPIVVLTGLADEATAGAAVERGAQDYLVKGNFTPDVLRRSILYAVQRQQFVAATIRGKRDAEARTKLAAIVESSDDAMFTESLDGVITSWNLGAQRMYGYSAAEAIGKTVSFLLPPEGDAQLQPTVEAVRRGTFIQQFDAVRIRKDGSRVDVSLSVSHFTDDDGRIIGISKVARDISDRKRAEAALCERVRLATLTADVGIILTQRQTLPAMLQGCAELLVEHLDVAFARIWTFNARDSVLELQASAGMYTHLDGPHRRIALGAFKIGQIASDRKPHVTNQVTSDPRISDPQWAKREGMVGFAGYPLVCEERLDGVVAMFSQREISTAAIEALEAVADAIAMGIERFRVADELQASEERFELAMRGSNDGLWDWQITTGALFLSPRIQEMWGTVADVGVPNDISSWLSRLHPQERDAVWAQIQHAISSHTQFVSEHRERTENGEYRWFLARGQALWDENGQAYRMAGSVTDITERKQMEATIAERDKQLRQAQKLEAVGSLAGGIAHEFNNLLQAIGGFTKLAMDGLKSDSRPFEDLQLVNQAAERASMLTRQLLGFSRHQVLNRDLVDPSTIVADMVKMIRPLIGEQIELEVSLERGAAKLNADDCLLQQMLMNLCINARDAMPSGGRLTLKTELVVLDAEYCEIHPPLKPGSYILFSVSDTGCGMSQDTKDRIFEPFFTTKEVGRGTGLGLALVYGIVNQHEGVIDVDSELGTGTTFKIYLPAVADEELDVAEKEPRSVRGGQETILIAEDDPMVRDLVARILKDAGYSLLIAADGAEAIELFDAHAEMISLALLDAIMPKYTGREVHDRIKLKKPELPVVFCSGYDPDLQQAKFLRDEGLRLVRKPYQVETLLAAIREVLDASQLSDTATCPR